MRACKCAHTHTSTHEDAHIRPLEPIPCYPPPQLKSWEGGRFVKESPPSTAKDLTQLDNDTAIVNRCMPPRGNLSGDICLTCTVKPTGHVVLDAHVGVVYMYCVHGALRLHFVLVTGRCNGFHPNIIHYNILYSYHHTEVITPLYQSKSSLQSNTTKEPSPIKKTDNRHSRNASQLIFL